MASEIESNLRDTVDWDRKWHIDFGIAKARFVSFDRSYNSGAIDRYYNSGAIGLCLKNYFLRCHVCVPHLK